MTLYHTLGSSDRVIAIHRTLADAHAFAVNCTAAERIVSALRATYDPVKRKLVNSPIYGRSDRFKMACAIDVYSVRG